MWYTLKEIRGYSVPIGLQEPPDKSFSQAPLLLRKDGLGRCERHFTKVQEHPTGLPIAMRVTLGQLGAITPTAFERMDSRR